MAASAARAITRPSAAPAETAATQSRRAAGRPCAPATAAAAAGASERSIANQTGHKSMQVLRRYIAQATTFDDNAANDLGL